MPKKLADYSRIDWLRLRPITQFIKLARYNRANARYCQLLPRVGEMPSIIDRCQGNRVMVTIAFNDPEVVQVQAKLIQRFTQDSIHVVADNSSDDSAAKSIEENCRAANVQYVRLPNNPWQGQSVASRSHGQAMNWVWQRIHLIAEPTAFGFIDHDLFPTTACDPFEPLLRHAFYGDKRWASDRWFLWAGFCFFRFQDVASLKLDFSQDWFLGLDTGGANWDSLYRRTDPARLPDRPVYPIDILPDIAMKKAYVEWRGDWLHEVGLDGDLCLRTAKRKAMLRLLQEKIGDPCDSIELANC